MSTIRQELIIQTLDAGATLADYFTTGRVTLNTSSYSGSCKYYFAGYGSAASGSAGNTRLRRYGTTTDDVNVASTTLLGTTAGWFEYEFTPPAGASTTYIVYIDNPNKNPGVNIHKPMIIVKQTGAPITATETQFIVGIMDGDGSFSTTGKAQTYPPYWYYDSSLWDGTKAFYFEAVFIGPTTKSNATVKLQVADGTGDGFVNWADVTNATVSAASTNYTMVRSSAFTPTNGRWHRIVVVSPTSKSGVYVHLARIIVVSTATPTKIETQYLVAPGLLAYNTNAQTDRPCYFDPADWVGVNNTYKYQVCGANGDTSVSHLQKSADGNSGSALSGSTVTQPDNAQISAAVTMPTAALLCARQTTATASVYNTKVLVQVTTVASQIKKVDLVALASIKKVSSVAIASIKKLAGVSNT